VLIVGCGCRGRELAAGLVADGHAVRGTTRDPDSVAAIEAAGAQAVVADPGKLGTLLPQIEGVSVICWLLASATGDASPLHRERLTSLLERLVDAPVRGFVYEAAGSVEAGVLAEGTAAVRAFQSTFHVPVGLIEADPADAEGWAAAALEAVRSVLA
jgi:nucleoside-diphosphate-sugar epimerase